MENITRYGASRPNCPLCGAYPGDNCKTASGRTTNRHVARIKAETAYSEAEASHYALELARVERERIARLDRTYALSMPASYEGGVVTEGHIAYCARNGHATLNGTAPRCHRCGELQNVSAVVISAVEDGTTASGATIWSHVEVEVRGGEDMADKTNAAHDALETCANLNGTVPVITGYYFEENTHTGAMVFTFNQENS